MKLAKDSKYFKVGNPDLEEIYVCHYCGLSHLKVEAGGVWHCPNITCSGPGNCYFASKLKSAKKISSGGIEIDVLELLEVAKARSLEEKDFDIVKAL